MRSWLLFCAACSSAPATDPPKPVQDAGAVVDAAAEAGAAATVSGTAAGQTLAPKDVVAIKRSEEVGGEKRISLVVSIRDAAGICGDLKGGRAVKQSTSLTLRVVLANPHTQPVIADQTYDLAKDGQIEGGNYLTVNAKISKLDDFCQESLADAARTATAGTITVSGATRGSFDLSFGAEKLTGTFDAPLCDVDPSQIPARPICR